MFLDDYNIFEKRSIFTYSLIMYYERNNNTMKATVMHYETLNVLWK